MGTIWVREFKGGLDARRLPEATSGGVLIKAQDGHINRGGEFEQRCAFVPEYDLPAGATVGLAAVPSTGLYTFGHDAAPTMPSGVTYQRLQNGSNVLTRVASYDLFAGKIYAAAEYDDGSCLHFYDGTSVSSWADGRARAQFQVVSGTAASSTIQIKVNGIAIMASAVTWTTSNSATATAIASAINSYASTPEYIATAQGDLVNIIASSAGTASNGLIVDFTLVNSFTVTPTLTALAGGADGSFPLPGSFVKTIGSKMFALASQYLATSGIQAPTAWSDTTGAGFIDMSQQSSGLETLTSLGEYNTLVAVFSERVIMTWQFTSDLAASAKQQTLRNTGTGSPRSVTQVGDADLYYLDESGLRSLRARVNTDSATTSDIGNPVDALIVEKLAELSTDERLNVIGLINPQDGRFWLIMKDVIYVFTYFAGSKVSAWSTYTPHYYDGDTKVDFEIDDACIYNRRVYLRGGDKVFCYGGIDTGTEHDATVAKAWMPGMDGDTPTVEKEWTGVDAAARGHWQVSAVTNPNTIDTAADADADVIGRVFRTTYNDEGIGNVGKSTHISLRFESVGAGPHKLSSCVIHFASEEK